MRGRRFRLELGVGKHTILFLEQDQAPQQRFAQSTGSRNDAAGIGDRDDIEAAATSAAAECPGASAPPQKLVDDNTPHAAKAREMQSGGWSR